MEIKVTVTLGTVYEGSVSGTEEYGRMRCSYSRADSMLRSMPNRCNSEGLGEPLIERICSGVLISDVPAVVVTAPTTSTSSKYCRIGIADDSGLAKYLSKCLWRGLLPST